MTGGGGFISVHLCRLSAETHKHFKLRLKPDASPRLPLDFALEVYDRTAPEWPFPTRSQVGRIQDPKRCRKPRRQVPDPLGAESLRSGYCGAILS